MFVFNEIVLNCLKYRIKTLFCLFFNRKNDQNKIYYSINFLSRAKKNNLTLNP